MMKTNVMRLAACVLLTLALALGAAATAQAAADRETENSQTHYHAVLLDDADLLSAEEEAEVMRSMEPLTDYGNVMLWTTAEHAANGELRQAENKRNALFGRASGAIFVINMSDRKLTIHADGDLNRAVTDSAARSITNNVMRDASNGSYAVCAENAFAQMLDLAQGKAITEPMKYLSYAMLALMAGVIGALAFAFSKRANPLMEETNQFHAQPQNSKAFCQSVQVVRVGGASPQSSAKGKASHIGVQILLFFLEVLVDAIGGSSSGRGGGSHGGSGGSSSF